MKIRKKPLVEKIWIKATDYPDWDYVINQLIRLAEKQNEIIDALERVRNEST